MIPKFKVVGDPKNQERFSSSIIINSLNTGAKNVGLYSDCDSVVVYDCIGNSHGYDADALIVCYELPFPDYVNINCKNKPIFTVSKDNLRFAIDGGYPSELCNYIHLGVDTGIWRPVTRKPDNKFVVLSYTESLARSGLEILVDSFHTAFQGEQDVQLFIKDRNATPKFESWIRHECDELGINLRYENRHIADTEEVRDIFSQADCHVYLNRSTTWGMTVLESMACGLPTFSPAYSGPREFIVNHFSGVEVPYNITTVDSEIHYLESIGQRNFFFPRRPTDYWCRPDSFELAKQLSAFRKNTGYQKRIRDNGIALAKSFTWERSALMIAEGLRQYENFSLHGVRR